MHIDLWEGNLNTFLVEGFQTLLVKITAQTEKICGLTIGANGEFDARVLHGGHANEGWGIGESLFVGCDYAENDRLDLFYVASVRYTQRDLRTADLLTRMDDVIVPLGIEMLMLSGVLIRV